MSKKKKITSESRAKDCELPEAKKKQEIIQVSAVWPEYRPLSKHSVSCELKAITVTGLKPLKINGWWLEQNPEFSYLSFSLKPKTHVTAKRWHDVFSCLGHEHNIIMTAPSFKFLLYRPSCIHVDKGVISFCYLTYAPTLLPELE